ncbi:MAG: hypothetical protein ACYCO9_13855 [Streptosporangiaceae bacterium]
MGWRVSGNTVAALMAQQHLAARPGRRGRRGTTRPGRGRWRAPDLIGRDFPAGTINRKWYGDGAEIATDEGKLYLDSVQGSRRILGTRSASTTTQSWRTARWPRRWLCAAAPPAQC